jgi:hypothetical protein
MFLNVKGGREGMGCKKGRGGGEGEENERSSQSVSHSWHGSQNTQVSLMLVD